MSKSKLGNKHYFIFQHRELLWSWGVDNETLQKHKEKVIPAITEDKQCGINKIVNGFSDYDGDDMEMKVYNGCIEHAFAMKGDITERDERIHWLYIGNGEKGKYLELEELEDKQLQLSYLSNSISDKDIPNMKLIVAWKELSEKYDNDNDIEDFVKERFNMIFRTLLHTEVLHQVIRNVGGFIKSGKYTDPRDIFLHNECLNIAIYQLRKGIKNKQFVKDIEELGIQKILDGLESLVEKTFDYSTDLYGNEGLDYHIKYSFYNCLGRNQRLEVRNNKKKFKALQTLVENPSDNMDKMKVVFGENK